MSNSDLLIKGDLIKSRWRIVQKIGGGGFGQIFQAYDKLRRDFVAVKVESNTQARQGIRMEVTVLRRIHNQEHVCELLSGGTSTFYNYMVMTLLGASLSELRRHSTEQCFSLSTSLRVSLQILEAIESVHSVGFLHRDIKPSNFAIGKGNSRQIYILDFGLARKYMDYDQCVRPARPEAGFRGTVRYASINAHNNRDLGRHDDLWSFFYMLVEFLIGSLPWSRVKDKESVGRMKESYDCTRFLTYLPDEFDKALEHLHQLHYEDTPDYDFLRSLFTSAIERLGYHPDDPYDWEISVDDNETDSLMKAEKKQRRQYAETDDRKQVSRTTPDSQYHLQARPSVPIPSHRQGTSTVKQDGNGDQEHAGHMNSRSPDTIARRSEHSGVTDRGQGTSQALLTFISQPFSHAAAPGTPSLLSQWTPHNGETLTEDDVLKADERSSSAYSRQNRSPSTGKKCPGRPLFAPIIGHDLHLHKNENHSDQPQSLPPRPTDVPFGSYMKNTNYPRLR